MKLNILTLYKIFILSRSGGTQWLRDTSNRDEFQKFLNPFSFFKPEVGKFGGNLANLLSD